MSEFEGADSGASDTSPIQCSSLHENGYVVIEGRPCKIVKMSTTKSGKHSHATFHLTAIDIFTGKEYRENICPSTHYMNVPIVVRQKYQLINIDEGYLTLMDAANETRYDIKVPDGELGIEITTKFNENVQLMVTILKAMGEEKVVAVNKIGEGFFKYFDQ